MNHPTILMCSSRACHCACVHARAWTYLRIRAIREGFGSSLVAGSVHRPSIHRVHWLASSGVTLTQVAPLVEQFRHSLQPWLYPRRRPIYPRLVPNRLPIRMLTFHSVFSTKQVLGPDPRGNAIFTAHTRTNMNTSIRASLGKDAN